MGLFETYFACEWRIPYGTGDAWLVVRPAAQHTAPPARPTHIITAWNPFGTPMSIGRNIANREDMEGHVLYAGGWFRVGAALALDRAWAEEVLVIEGFDDQTAARFAAEHGQWIFWRWDEQALHLLEWGWGAELDSHPVEARPIDRRPCPVGDGASGPCWRPAHADQAEQVAFDRRRTTLICSAGCDDCDGGRLLERHIDPNWDGAWAVPSRYQSGERNG
jgi:hypothetical protein